MKNLLSTIRNVESESDEKIRNARAILKEKITAAEAEAQAMLQTGLRENQLEYERLVKQYEDEGLKRVQTIQTDIQNQCNVLVEKASAKIDIAAQKILERIII